VEAVGYALVGGHPEQEKGDTGLWHDGGDFLFDLLDTVIL